MPVVLLAVGLALGLLVGYQLAKRSRPTVDDPAAAVRRGADADSFELLEDQPHGVVLADASGRLLYRNRVARELDGTHVGALIDEAIQRHLADVLRDGVAREELELYGPPRVVLAFEARRIADDRVLVHIDDLSEQRRIEQVRTDFVSNISHELRTPVGAMAVLAETLEDETDPDTIQRVVGRIMAEAVRASRTIDDLLELSRVELGGELGPAPVEISGVLAAALDRVTEMASQRNIEVANLISIGDLDGLAVFGNRRQLVSALGNLVENAVKYSGDRSQVQVSTRVVDDQVEISVTDQGIGIPQRDLDRIFERFYRVDRARSRETGGTGLGLSIVRHVVANHDGTVAVRSVEGQGSTFIVRLPVVAATADVVPAETDNDDSVHESEREIA